MRSLANVRRFGLKATAGKHNERGIISSGEKKKESSKNLNNNKSTPHARSLLESDGAFGDHRKVVGGGAEKAPAGDGG